MSPRTLCASTIRPTRSRPEHPHQPSRPPQNRPRRRLSRLLPSHNQRSFSPEFALRQNAPDKIGSVLFFLRRGVPCLTEFAFGAALVSMLFAASGILSDLSVRFLSGTA